MFFLYYITADTESEEKRRDILPPFVFNISSGGQNLTAPTTLPAIANCELRIENYFMISAIMPIASVASGMGNKG